MSLEMDLSFISTVAHATLITDGPDRTFIQKGVERDANGKTDVKILPQGGFVIVAGNR